MNNDFPSILKDFLTYNDLSQTAFAEKIGVHQGQVSEWMHGKAKPGYDTLRQICITFDVSADYFLGLDDNY